MINLRQIENMNEFTLDEAVSLIYTMVVLKDETGQFPDSPGIIELGHICGVLTLNDQIEIVIKFHDSLKQFNKHEFLDNVKISKQKY